MGWRRVVKACCNSWGAGYRAGVRLAGRGLGHCSTAASPAGRVIQALAALRRGCIVNNVPADNDGYVWLGAVLGGWLGSGAQRGWCCVLGCAVGSIKRENMTRRARNSSHPPTAGSPTSESRAAVVPAPQRIRVPSSPFELGDSRSWLDDPGRRLERSVTYNTPY